MKSLQTAMISTSAAVTSTAQVLFSGPCWYFGATVNRDPGKSGCTLVISDSSSAVGGGSTGTDILDWIRTYQGGTSLTGSLINTRSDMGMKVTSGLRVQCVGLNGVGGTTILIHWS